MKHVLKSLAIIIVLFFGGFLFLLTTHVGGWRGFIVMSASMEPAIPTGSLVVTQQTSPNSLQKNDVITFVRPNKTSELITHRIATIMHTNNVTAIKTKGDNNVQNDSWILAGGGVVGKVQISIPYLGYLLTFTKTKLGILFFILVPSVYIIVQELQSIAALFGKKKKETIEVVDRGVLFITIALGVSSFLMKPTEALLSDRTQLTRNHFTISQDTTAEDCDEEKEIQKNH